ncbi:MAG: alpha/beta fold hydrolase [Vicingaceae bacterium]
MQLTEIPNIKFIGAGGRPSLLDVILPQKVVKMPLVIFAHGFKGFKDWGHFPLLSKKIAEAGFAVVKFNFSHNGGTLEEPIDFPDLKAFSENTYSKEQADLKSIINWAKKEQELPMGYWNKKEVYLVGHSRGGSMAILQAAQNSAIKKVVSWAAVSDLQKRLPSETELKKWKSKGVRYIKNGRTEQEMPMKYQFVEDLLANQEELNLQLATKQINIPQLILHATDDEAVPVEMAQELKKWNPNADLKLINKGGHTFGGKHPYLKEKLPKPSEILLEHTVNFLKS